MDAHEALFDELRPKPPKMSLRTRALGTLLGAAETIMPPGKSPWEVFTGFLGDLKQRFNLANTDPKALEAANEKSFNDLMARAKSGDPKAHGQIGAMLLPLVLGGARSFAGEAPEAVSARPGVNHEALQKMLGDMFEPKAGALKWAPDDAEMLSSGKTQDVAGFDEWLENVEKPKSKRKPATADEIMGAIKQALPSLNLPTEHPGFPNVTAQTLGDWWRQAYPVKYRHPMRDVELGEQLPPVPGAAEWYGPRPGEEGPHAIRVTDEGTTEEMPAQEWPPLHVRRENLSRAMQETWGPNDLSPSPPPGYEAQQIMRGVRKVERDMAEMIRGQVMREDVGYTDASSLPLLLKNVKKLDALTLLKGLSKQ